MSFEHDDAEMYEAERGAARGGAGDERTPGVREYGPVLRAWFARTTQTERWAALDRQRAAADEVQERADASMRAAGYRRDNGRWIL